MSIKITQHVFNKIVLQILRVKEIKSSLHDVYSESSPITKVLPLYFISSVWKHNTSPNAVCLLCYFLSCCLYIIFLIDLNNSKCFMKTQCWECLGPANIHPVLGREGLSRQEIYLGFP